MSVCRNECDAITFAMALMTISSVTLVYCAMVISQSSDISLNPIMMCVLMIVMAAYGAYAVYYHRMSMRKKQYAVSMNNEPMDPFMSWIQTIFRRD